MLALIATLTPNRIYISSQLSRGSTCRRIRYRMFSQPGGLWACCRSMHSEVVEGHFRVDSKSWIEPFRGDMQKPPPLIWAHVNPYGLFRLDMNKRLAIEADEAAA